MKVFEFFAIEHKATGKLMPINIRRKGSTADWDPYAKDNKRQGPRLWTCEKDAEASLERWQRANGGITQEVFIVPITLCKVNNANSLDW